MDTAHSAHDAFVLAALLFPQRVCMLCLSARSREKTCGVIVVPALTLPTRISSAVHDTVAL